MTTKNKIKLLTSVQGVYDFMTANLPWAKCIVIFCINKQNEVECTQVTSK